jgi:hypothetical protein
MKKMDTTSQPYKLCRTGTGGAAPPRHVHQIAISAHCDQTTQLSTTHHRRPSRPTYTHIGGRLEEAPPPPVTGVHHDPPLHYKSPSNPASMPIMTNNRPPSIHIAMSQALYLHRGRRRRCCASPRPSLRRQLLEHAHHTKGGLQHRPMQRHIPRHGGHKRHRTRALHPHR